jgi:integrase
MNIGTMVQSYLSYLGRMERKSFRQAYSHSARLRSCETEVDQWDPNLYIERRRAEGAKSATINRECEIVKQAAKHWVRENPGSAVGLRYVPRLPENNVRTGFFERDDFLRVCAALPRHLALVTRFAYVTGWRKSEILSLRWDQVNKEIRIHDSKNGHGRVVPVSGPLQEIIEDALMSKFPECPLVFQDPSGHRIGDFRKAWKSACKQAGCPDRLFHDLRRTAVRNMIEAGIDRQVAKAITGHRTDSMFTRYQIVDQRQMTAALEKL